MTNIITSLLSNQQVVDLLLWGLGIGIGVLGKYLHELNAKDRRLAGLDEIEGAVEDSIQAALKSASGASKADLLPTVISTARSQLLKDSPKLAQGAEVSLDVLLAGHADQKLVDAPGGAVVKLPGLGDGK